MKVDLYCPEVTLPNQVRKLFQRRVTQLERRLKRYHPDACHLVAHFTRDAKQRYHLSLELRVLHKVLAARREGFELLQLTREAFEALVKEFEKYRLKLNKSLRARKQVKPVERAAVTPQKLESVPLLLREAIESQLKAMLGLARQEILHYQVTGVLEPGELLPQDVVDEAIARVAEQVSEQMTRPEMERLLLREVLRVAKRFAREVETQRSREISLNLPLDQIPDPEEVSTLGEEILYFYEPDEALKLEDVTEDPSALTPEEVVENQELQHLLVSTLSELPETARQVFTLVDIEGLSVEEAAMVLAKTPEQIEQILHNTEEVLRSKLGRAEEPLSREQLRLVYGEMRKLQVAGIQVAEAKS